MLAVDGNARPNALMETDWIDEHKGDPDVRLIEVDVDTSAYKSGHIPGAVGWNRRIDLLRSPGRNIPTRDEWQALLSRSCIGSETTVVLYGDNNNLFAAYTYWLFKLYSHDNVHLMNGGRTKWISEERDLTTEAPNPKATGYRAKGTTPGLRADRNDVMSIIGASGYTLVDVRSQKEYAGELLAPADPPQEGAVYGNHLPGAQNIPWGTAVADDGTFKSAGELREIFRSKGVTPDRPVIVYSHAGWRSAHTWFVLHELLGYPDVRNYDGSWTEWGSLVRAPIEREASQNRLKIE